MRPTAHSGSALAMILLRGTMILFMGLAGVMLSVVGSTAAESPVTAATVAAKQADTTLRLPTIRLHGDALTGGARSITVEEIDALAPAIDWTIWDPYKVRTNHYQGIALQYLVRALAPNAQSIRLRAINDYITVLERHEWESLPIMLATRDEGARMTVANKGPARIVYPQTRDNERVMQIYAPKWIWQIVDVEFNAR